ncbi:MAG: GTP-binding protein [Candidatus Hodarchaeales archaeon]
MSFLMKIVLAGDGAVGKTALRERYLGKGFSSNYMMTIGADFALKEAQIRDKNIKFQIWDLAGQPRFGTVRSVYYYGCLGALLLFDVTRPDTFTNLESWLDEIFKHNGKGMIPVVLLGNKVDLREQFPNHVTDAQAEEFAAKLSEKTMEQGFPVKYMPTSAKTGLNVSAAFDMLGNVYLDYVEAQTAK